MNRDTQIKLNVITVDQIPESDTPEWHCYNDILETANKDYVTTLGVMMDKFEKELEYYECYLGPLLANHIIEIKE